MAPRTRTKGKKMSAVHFIITRSSLYPGVVVAVVGFIFVQPAPNHSQTRNSNPVTSTSKSTSQNVPCVALVGQLYVKSISVARGGAPPPQ